MTESEKTAVENLFQLISAMTREQQERLLLYVRGIIDGKKLMK